MIDIRVFFISVSHFFCFLWAAFVRLFVSSPRSHPKPGDIEAGIPPAQSDIKITTVPCPHPHHKDLESGIYCPICFSASFVEIDINSPDQPPSTYFGDAIAFGSPIHITSWPRIEPTQFNIGTTPEPVQDKALTCVFKPVIITPEHPVTACSAEVEYFDERDFSTCEPEAPQSEIKLSSSAGIPVPKVEAFTPTLDVVHEEAFPFSGDECVDETLAELPAFVSECKSRVVRFGSERRSRKRNGLLDLLDQFPDVPRHLPPGPHALVTNPALASPPSSEKSTCSSTSPNASYGFTAEDTPDTSAPGSPETQTDESFFAVSGQTKVDGEAKSGKSRASQAESVRWSRLESSGVNAARKATARAVLSGYQSDESEVGLDSILEQLEGSSFGSSCHRQSLVWFGDAALSTLPTSAEPATEGVAPLRIVKRSKVAEVEDDVVTRELLRWEESRQRGLRAFREAKSQKADFCDLASCGT